MCGGKGGSGGTSPTFSQPSPITTQQNINQATQQQQQYQADPLTQLYVRQALGAAGDAALSPFNMPVQQMAGFTPMQQQYFGTIAGIQGMTDPYFAQAQNYMGQGAGLIGRGAGYAGQGLGAAGQGFGVAGGQLGGIGQAQQNVGLGQGILAGGIPGVSAAGTPVTAGNIADYMNPYAADTLAAMKKYVFDPQRTQTMGQQTQMAGGVGADRLALASQNIDKTQADAIAAAQAGFWQPAMSMAEQQKQMALQSGLGMGTLGTGFGNLAMGQGQLGLGAANVGLGMGNLGLGMGNLGLGVGGLGSQMANIGSAYGGLGTSAQQAALQAAGALGGAGAQQQQLNQAQLNAQYRQAMAQQAYPFQTAQFLAGITGGLAPALGGTTTGAGFTSGAGLGTQMPSQPAWGSQLFGGLLGGAGLLGSLGAFDGSGKGGAPAGGSLYDPFGGGSYGAIYKRGGRTFQRGGMNVPDDPIVIDPEPDYRIQPTTPRGGPSPDPSTLGTPIAGPINPFAGPSYGGGGPGMFAPSFWPDPDKLIFKNFGPAATAIPKTPTWMAKGGDVEDEAPIDAEPITADEPAGLNIPSLRLPMGSGAQTGAKLDLSPGVQFPLPWTMQQQQGASGSGSGGSNVLGQAIGFGLKVLPFLLARGGAVNPFDAGQPFQEGGGTDDPFEVDQPHLGFGDVMSAAKKYYSPMVESFGQAVAPPTEDPIKGIIPRMIGGMRSAPAAPVAPAAIAPGAFKMPESAPAMPAERPTEASLTDPSAKLPDIYRATHSELSKAYGPQVASAITANLGVESPSLNPAESHDRGTGIGIAGWRNERRDALYDFAGERRLDPLDRRTQLAFLQHEIGADPQYSDMLKRMQAAKSPSEAARIFRMEYERPAGTPQGRPLGLNQAQQLATQFHAGNFSNAGAGGGPSYERPAFADYQPSSVLDRYGPRQREPMDWGQRAARSPWLSLVSAGAAMMTAPGNLGSAIGYGLDAGAKTLQAQRKALDSEDLIQQKADMLTERADQHLREYQRKSEYADIRTRIAEEREARLREKETRIKEHAPMAYKDALREARENNPGLLGNPDALHEAALEIMRRDPARTGTTAPTGTPVGTRKKSKAGEFEKINAGPDSDASTWRKVGT